MVVNREWQYMEAKRKDFEAAHEWVIRQCHPPNGAAINPDSLARAWGASDKAYREYAEAYRAFFPTVVRSRR